MFYGTAAERRNINPQTNAQPKRHVDLAWTKRLVINQQSVRTHLGMQLHYTEITRYDRSVSKWGDRDSTKILISNLRIPGRLPSEQLNQITLESIQLRESEYFLRKASD